MSFTISMIFPAGKYVAASWDDKEKVEWPPHPARFCLGMIDALHRHGNPSDWRDALQWLCSQGAPDFIVLPASDFTSIRNMDGFFVPQNPSSPKDIKHPRKARSFPTVFLDPDQPSIFFHWDHAEIPEKLNNPLRALLAALPRYGHSSSLVIAEISENSPPCGAEWQQIRKSESEFNAPSEFQLRTPFPTLLEAAEKAFDADGRASEMETLIHNSSKINKAGTLPRPAASPRVRHDPPHVWQGYSTAISEETTSGPWSHELLILTKTSGDRLGLVSTWQLTEIFHKSIIDHWCRHHSLSSLPSWISGHTTGKNGEKTAATKDCHISIFPLAHIGSKHADGHLLGLGIALPKPESIGITRSELISSWRKILQVLLSKNGTVELAPKDRSWNIQLRAETSLKPPLALLPSRWTHAATTWSTVTPIILDRHPKPHFKKDPVAWRKSCQSIIALACENLGLPAPLSIEPSPYSSLQGTPSAPSMPAPKARRDRPARFHIHANITFPEKVIGPILLGAGRFRGYGLCLPNSSENQSQ